MTNVIPFLFAEYLRTHSQIGLVEDLAVIKQSSIALVSQLDSLESIQFTKLSGTKSNHLKHL